MHALFCILWIMVVEVFGDSKGIAFFGVQFCCAPFLFYAIRNATN